jgi:hypothetical protein
VVVGAPIDLPDTIRWGRARALPAPALRRRAASPARAAPQFGSAKDALNLAGMVAANALQGLHPVASWDELPRIRGEVAAGKALLVDVREVRPAPYRS